MTQDIEHIVNTKKFGDLKLVKHYDDFIGSESGENLPLRVYAGPFMEEKHGNKYVRWHFGFHKKMLPEAMMPILHTTIYWAEPYHATDGDFYIYWLSVTSERDEWPQDKLTTQIKIFLRRHNECRRFLVRAAGM